MRLILVRHGYTDDLKNNIVQGHRPTPLNRQGVHQAKRVAEYLRRYKIHRIYTSDSRRASQTAAYIVRHHPHLELTAWPLLREKAGGVFEGRSMTYARRRLRRNFHSYRHRPPGGESWSDLFRRGVKTIQRFRRLHPRRTVLIVSHGGMIRSMLTYIFHGRSGKFHPEYHHDNTGVTVVAWRKNRPRVVVLNDTRHLSAKSRT